eukprot:4822394-Amphidinium_carterae.1
MSKKLTCLAQVCVCVPCVALWPATNTHGKAKSRQQVVQVRQPSSYPLFATIHMAIVDEDFPIAAKEAHEYIIKHPEPEPHQSSMYNSSIQPHPQTVQTSAAQGATQRKQPLSSTLLSTLEANTANVSEALTVAQHKPWAK